MRYWLVAGVAMAIAGPVCAQDVTVKPLAEARIRWEHVDQDGLALPADAVTFRLRGGATASVERWTALVEGQANVALVGDYYDGIHGAAVRPLVADPENIALYRAQLQYKGKDATLTVGRQRIAIDDERFVGSAPIRQNAQTFDAARVEWSPAKGLKADLIYAWALRTVWGTDGTGPRPRAIGGDNVFANLSYVTPIGTVSAFAYLVDQDDSRVQGFRLSSQSYGMRFAGSRPLGGKAKINYAASFAEQSEYHRNPNDYTARYYILDGSVEASGLRAGAAYEVLGASNGAALTSFQTPAGTAFRFHGWAGKFSPNPPDGLRDLFGTLAYTIPKAGQLSAITFQAQYHRFESDRLMRHYGDELDLLASAKLGKYTLAVRYADYRADLFATDTKKLLLQLDWAL